MIGSGSRSSTWCRATDLGRLPDRLPALLLPRVPASLETLRIVAPYALAMAMVRLLESMMTASVVNDLTKTTSSKRRECVGLGLANCAAGIFLLLLMVALRPWVACVPVAALVSTMIMVSISTFSWASLRSLLTQPKVSSMVMLATVAVVVATKDLAVGVLLSGVFFAFKVMRLMGKCAARSTCATPRSGSASICGRPICGT